MITHRLFRAAGALGRCRRGAIAVEFGLLAPVVGAIALGLAEYAGAVAHSMELTRAARTGVEYAARYPSDTAGTTQAITGSGHVDPAGLAIAVDQFCECPDGTPVACADSCSGVQNNIYMRVALSQPARSLLAASGVMAGYTVDGRATLRLR